MAASEAKQFPLSLLPDLGKRDNKPEYELDDHPKLFIFKHFPDFLVFMTCTQKYDINRIQCRAGEAAAHPR